jgi:hypothetical protein
LNAEKKPIDESESMPTSEVLAEHCKLLKELREDAKIHAERQERFNGALVTAVQSIDEYVKNDHSLLQHHTDILLRISEAYADDGNGAKNKHKKATHTDSNLGQQQQQQMQMTGFISGSILPPKKSRLSDTVHDLKSLFFNWYRDDMWLYKPEDSNERSVFRKMSHLMIYLKLFLKPECTLLQRRPNPNTPADANQYRDWLNQIQSCGKTLQNDLMNFCKEYTLTATPAQPLKDVVIRKAAIWAVEKMLKKIPAKSFPAVTVQAIDNLTIDSPYICNSNTISAFHKLP